MKPKTIAIDGPAGSGKSTLGRELARRLGYAMLDAGLLYRLVTANVIQTGTMTSDQSAIEAVARDVFADLDLHDGPNGWTVMIADRELAELRLDTDEISALVPTVAQCPGVRSMVRSVQERIMNAGHSILAGRDIGTVVAPQAELKLYLDVSLEERASRRRWSGGPGGASQSEIETALKHRDHLDQTRKQSPLRVPPDAVIIRTDQLSVDETVDAIIEMCGLDAAHR